jgi:hypothetical protein
MFFSIMLFTQIWLRAKILRGAVCVFRSNNTAVRLSGARALLERFLLLRQFGGWS